MESHWVPASHFLGRGREYEGEARATTMIGNAQRPWGEGPVEGLGDSGSLWAGVEGALATPGSAGFQSPQLLSGSLGPGVSEQPQTAEGPVPPTPRSGGRAAAAHDWAGRAPPLRACKPDAPAQRPETAAVPAPTLGVAKDEASRRV